MARGWESKDIKAQMEEAQERADLARRPRFTPAQIKLQRECESLELSRTRVLQDMQTAQNPRYQKQLEESLRFLEEKIRQLEAAPS